MGEEREPGYRGEKVIVSKKHEWFKYADAVVRVLESGRMASVEARGRPNIEKGVGMLATLVQRYPDIVVEGGIVTVTFKGTQGDDVKAPQANWTVAAKSALVRIRQEPRPQPTATTVPK